MRKWWKGALASLVALGSFSCHQRSARPPPPPQGHPPPGSYYGHPPQASPPPQGGYPPPGSNYGPPSPPPADVGRYCQAFCAQQGRCKGAPQQPCVASCVQQRQEAFRRFDPEFVHTAAACLDRLPCGRSDDFCLHEGFQTRMRHPEVAAASQQCHARRNECGKGFPDDLCFSIAALAGPALARARGCLTQACPAIGDCLRAAGAFNY